MFQDQFLLEVAEQMPTEVKSLGIRLGLPDSKVSAIVLDNQSSVTNQALAVLQT